MLQVRSTSLLMVVLLALHREALIADERFERPNKGFRGPCLTSLANRQKHDTVSILLQHIAKVYPLQLVYSYLTSCSLLQVSQRFLTNASRCDRQLSSFLVLANHQVIRLGTSTLVHGLSESFPESQTMIRISSIQSQPSGNVFQSPALSSSTTAIHLKYVYSDRLSY